MPDHNDDEIDLFELFMTLWEGKWKIILTTLAALACGFGYVSMSVPFVKGTVDIRQAPQANFTKYESLNTLALENDLTYELNAKTLFDSFKNEFNDYNEIINELETSPYFIERTQGLEGLDLIDAQIGLARRFTFETDPDADKPNAKEGELTYEWLDKYEARGIFERALLASFEHTKSKIIAEIDQLAQASKTNLENRKKSLRSELSAIADEISQEKEGRVLFLTEQSAIATELGITSNTLERSDLAASQNTSVSFNLNGSEVPYYLRGAKAIDKELALLSARSDEENYIMSPQYVRLSAKLAALNLDDTVEQILSTKALIEGEKIENWVYYDFRLATIEPMQKKSLILALSIILGGFIGMAYVLVQSAIRNRQQKSVA